MVGKPDPLKDGLAVVSSGGRGTQTPEPGRGQLVAGRYELLGLLGEGGMGAVYKARDTKLDELVALKMLRRELIANSDVLERFRREVKLARRVTHRNVARAHDIGEHNGQPFMTMELVQGESLARLLAKQGRRPVKQVLEIAQGLCAGLAAAHDVGVVHRDLKPDNVLIAEGGRVVVTDFGIARAIGPGIAALTHGDIVGTPTYMAPEQAEGLVNIDARADIYSLGVILFELFTGRVPFTGSSAFAVALARLSSSPPDPRTFGVPDAAAALVLRCMARDPNGRFSSVTKVAEALRELPTDWVLTPVGEPTIDEDSAYGQMHATSPLPSPGDTSSSLKAPATSHLSTHADGTRSIAVLPLRNVGQKEDDALADSFSESLIKQLALSDRLRVPDFSSVTQFRGLPQEARTLAMDLGVEVAIVGTVRRVGETLRISLRMLSVADGTELWSQQCDRPMKDILVAAHELSAAIVHALLPDTLNRLTTDPVALALYREARELYHRFEEVAVEAQLSSLRTCTMEALDLFGKARALAPDDPTILAGCTLALARSWFFDADGARTRAAEAASRVSRVAPGTASALVARAAVRLIEGNLAEAAEDAARAIAKAPDLADAHALLGRILVETGPAQRALQHLDIAARLDPGYSAACLAVLHVHELIGQRAEFDRLSRLAIGNKERGVGWASIARVILWRGDVVRARELWEHPMISSGKASSGREILRMLLQPDTSPSPVRMLTTSMGSVAASSSTRAFLSQVRAESAAAKGKTDAAFTALNEAVESGLVDLVWMDGCALLRALRADRRFAPLRAQVEGRAALVHLALRRAEDI